VDDVLDDPGVLRQDINPRVEVELVGGLPQAPADLDTPVQRLAAAPAVVSEYVTLDVSGAAPPIVWDRMGLWSFAAYPPRSRSPLMLVSRQIDEGEVDRNTERVQGNGYCGWIALEWASRGGNLAGRREVLRLPEDKIPLAVFLAGCAEVASGGVRAKVRRVVSLLTGDTPTFLSKESGCCCSRWWYGALILVMDGGA